MIVLVDWSLLADLDSSPKVEVQSKYKLKNKNKKLFTGIIANEILFKYENQRLHGAFNRSSGEQLPNIDLI